MDLDAIRARDAAAIGTEGPSLADDTYTQRTLDRHALLAEVDRLTALPPLAPDYEQGRSDGAAEERARIRAAVEGLGHFRCEDTYYSCRASDDYPLGDIEVGDCDCYMAAVLAAIEGGEHE